MYEEIRVKNVLNDIYREYGVDTSIRVSNSNPETCVYWEHHAKRKAHRHMETSERMKFDKALHACEDNLHLHYDAALSVLFRLGVFLSACERERK